MASIRDLPAAIRPYVKKSGKCWVWTGPTYNGYGVIYVPDSYGMPRRKFVHRVVFKHFNPNIDIRDKELHHTCYNKPCCNPDCLKPLSHWQHKLVTYSDKKKFEAKRRARRSQPQPAKSQFKRWLKILFS